VVVEGEGEGREEQLRAVGKCRHAVEPKGHKPLRAGVVAARVAAALVVEDKQVLGVGEMRSTLKTRTTKTTCRRT